MLYFWILFNAFALGMLLLDLFVFHRHGRIVRPREALAWSAMWVALAATFAGIILFWQGRQVALEFVTGYVLELSLSVDNLFLFLVIFRYFSVPEEHQRSVLFWGDAGRARDARFFHLCRRWPHSTLPLDSLRSGRAS